MALAGVLRTSVAPRPWKGPRKPFWRIVAATQPDTVVNAAAPGAHAKISGGRGACAARPGQRPANIDRPCFHGHPQGALPA